MNRSNARKIAETITNEQIVIMLNNAKNQIKDWTVVSKCNISFSKGYVWNILAADFDVNEDYHKLTKINLIREFGEYLPLELKPVKKAKEKIIPIHEKPKF